MFKILVGLNDIKPGWSIPGSRQMRYNVKWTPRNST
jgi:hypothetical protein